MMTYNYYYTVLTGVELLGDDLKLRLDLNQVKQRPQPILLLELKGCRDAPAALSTLQSQLDSAAELEFVSLEDPKTLEIMFDYAADPGLTIVFDDAISTFEEYSFADLERRLNRLTRIYEAQSVDQQRTERRCTRILDTLRRELRKDFDHATRKAAFFADAHPENPSKSQNMQGEASAYAKVLALLNRLESDRDTS